MRYQNNIFLLFVAFILLFSHSEALAQKFGYVDTNYVLSQMPEYGEAKVEIDKISTAWQAEVQEMVKEIQSMEASLKAEQVLLTKEMKDDRDKEIARMWNDVKEDQKKKFGFEGLLFLKKKELIKPVQDQVFEAVEKVSKKHRLQMMFDKSGDLVMIYTDPAHDYTDYVLEELGLGDKNDVISNN